VHEEVIWAGCLACVLSCTAASGANQPVAPNSALPSRIVTLHAGTDVDAFVAEFELHPKHVYRYALRGFAAPMDRAAVDRLKHDDRVMAVEMDGRVELQDAGVQEVIPAGRLTNQVVPSGLLRLGLPGFPLAHLSGSDHRINADVAVLDTGIQTNHPDLNVFQAVDATGSGLGGDDWNGHGTHVAGTIGALNNAFGVVGMAPGVRLWSVQVLTPEHNGTSDLISGLDYIAQHADQISVVNASVTINPESAVSFTAIQQAVRAIVNRGVVFVACVGNDSMDVAGADLIFGNGNDYLPAALPEVMAVSAMDPSNDTFAPFSNYNFLSNTISYVDSPGVAIDVCAPGVNILSTYKGGDYAIMTGTSMSSPHAAGAVGLYIAANGRATNAAGVYSIRQAIVDSGLPQALWLSSSNNPYGTGDPDGNPEPLLMPSVSWFPDPSILAANMTDGGFEILFRTTPGYSYAVQYRSSLASTNQWVDLIATNRVGAVSALSAIDPTRDPSRFYRIRRWIEP
jgi:subtilisin